MLKSSYTCPAPNYSHIVHLLEEITSVAPQLKYIINILLELKSKLAKIKTKVERLRSNCL